MNQLLVFVCDGAPVRGEFVSLGSAWQNIMERRKDPPAIQKIMGEFVAAAALLTASIKLNGTLIIQAQSHGPVRLLVVECTSQLEVRATVSLNPDFGEIPDKATLAELLDADGSGRLAITLDPADRKPSQTPYQGIVSLQRPSPSHPGLFEPIETVSEAIMLYMQSSEQIDTRIWLASSSQSLGGFLLQRLPDTGGASQYDPKMMAEGWERIQMLGNTITKEELLGVEPEILLRRLFLEESERFGVRSFPLRLIKFACRCSRQRVADVIRMLGQEEVDSILAELGAVETRCDFCGMQYRFDPVDCKQAFASPTLSDAVRPPSKGH
jgi:molecular chaperone Hsp33